MYNSRTCTSLLRTVDLMNAKRHHGKLALLYSLKKVYVVPPGFKSNVVINESSQIYGKEFEVNQARQIVNNDWMMIQRSNMQAKLSR